MHRTSSWILLVLSSLAATFATADDVLIKTRDGATLSATLALPTPRPEGRIPTIMEFDIYANPEAHQKLAEEFAARGYAGLVADTRGKRLSPDKIEPYEHEVRDTHAVLDWIVKQPWSDGKVGMIGSSYSGYSAWAATKDKHQALKGIAVSAAAIPGQGLPMHNNVFLTANYQWAFYVTNNKLLDDAVNDERPALLEASARLVHERPALSRDRRRGRHTEPAASALAHAPVIRQVLARAWCRTRAISRA